MPVYGDEGKYGEALVMIAGKRPADYGSVQVGGRTMFVKGDPAGLYRDIRAAVGFEKKLDYLPFDV
jgi:hypothetical protein